MAKYFTEWFASFWAAHRLTFPGRKPDEYKFVALMAYNEGMAHQRTVDGWAARKAKAND